MVRNQTPAHLYRPPPSRRDITGTKVLSEERGDQALCRAAQEPGICTRKTSPHNIQL